MRVLQIIDSLEAGGAERVAVNLANALTTEIEGSFLCTTRKEGLLKESVSSDVGYLFLNKHRTIDLKAVKSLNVFVKANDINIIHAHSSSFFLATILKILNRRVSVIWHDHYGNSDFVKSRKHGILRLCSKHFSHVFSVNRILETWAKQKLKIENVTYLANFASVDQNLLVTQLNGVTGKRVVCLANLRPQKDHFTLIDAFKSVVELYPDWTLHCVGKDFNDDYSKNVKSKIEATGLSESVFLYGSKPDVFNILSQCEIGVLSSKSEGLPIALLEYGLANLAVIATNVGECKNVILNNFNGLLVNSLDIKMFSKTLCIYIENEALRKEYSGRYKKNIQENFSKESKLEIILKIYKSCIR